MHRIYALSWYNCERVICGPGQREIEIRLADIKPDAIVWVNGDVVWYKSRRLDLNPDEKMAAQQYKGIRKSATTSAPLPKAAITERSLDPQETYSEAHTPVESKSRSRNVSVSSDVEVVELDSVSKKDDELDEDIIDLS